LILILLLLLFLLLLILWIIYGTSNTFMSIEMIHWWH